ncbi:2-polyprenyl-3-methyl-6-methoxy-1,4-benzoquinol hydroxylase, coq7 type [hydrothermal vent metagenome]|uniref:2-polyprenyl-3-methyl-6-methoxy-1,4-benzoquinol hydroxylase, coq7 type n=1 Tax=hydrothermal vent metagenome TaxID=652676 RepID=A0A3B0RLS3_9ZZZZ
MSHNQPKRKTKPVPPGPGRERRIGEMLRVDHAGETAAVGIYRGQQAVFGGVANKQHLAGQFAQMQAEEQVHLEAFETQLRQREQAPTLMIGLWQGMSYALGVGTALLGEKAAHACTEAVEDVIEKHYQAQIDELQTTGEEPELRDLFIQFRQDELGHRDSAVQAGAKQAAGYPVLSAVIRAGCKAAIRISEKI